MRRQNESVDSRVNLVPAPVARAFAPLTATGRTVAWIVIVAWVAAWQLGWDEWAVVAGIGIVALILAVPFTFGRMNLASEVRLEPQRVVVGERAAGEMVVRNTTALRSLPLTVELTVGVGLARFAVPSLAPEGTHDELFTLPTIRRAVLPVGPLSTVRSDPLGMIRRERRWGRIEELFIHPRTHRLDRLGAGFLRDLEGQATTQLSPSDIAFHTLREYVPGDDRRHIHWRSSAKLDKLMVRQFVDTRRSELLLLIGERADDYRSEDEFELAVSIAASLGVRALRDQQDVVFVGGSRLFAADTPQTLLDSSARLQAEERGGDLLQAASTGRRAAPNPTIVMCVTGSRVGDDQLRRAGAVLNGSGRTIVMVADESGAASRRSVGGVPCVGVPALDDLERILAGALQ